MEKETRTIVAHLRNDNASAYIAPITFTLMLVLFTLAFWFEAFTVSHWLAVQDVHVIAADLASGITVQNPSSYGILSDVQYHELPYTIPAQIPGYSSATSTNLVVITAQMPSLLGFPTSISAAAPLPVADFQSVQ